MEDIAKSVTEEMLALEIGLHDNSDLTLNSVKFDSYETELRDHEVKCLVHHDKLVMVKRALKRWNGQSPYRASLLGGFDSSSGNSWPEELRYKILNVRSAYSIRERSMHILSLIHI